MMNCYDKAFFKIWAGIYDNFGHEK